MKTSTLLFLIFFTLAVTGCAQQQAAKESSVSIQVLPSNESVETSSELGSPAETNKVPEKIIVIEAFRYTPETARIIPGTKVTWINKDAINHSVKSTSGPEKFDSGEIPPGGNYSRIFDGEGIFEYRCKDHRDMRGKITVQKISKEANVVIIS